MPPLTNAQVEIMQEKYDIHGPLDAEAGGVNRDNVDLTIPPAQVEGKDHFYNSDSENNTRVPSPVEGANGNEKIPRL